MAYLDGEGCSRHDLQIVHSFLDVLSALDGPAYRIVPSLLPVAQLFVDGWPHHDHRVAHKLDDVSAVLVQVGDHAFHVAIDAEGELFIASVTFLSAGLGQVGETADVGEDHHRLHGLQLGQLRFLVRLLFLYELLQHQGWNVLVKIIDVV